MKQGASTGVLDEFLADICIGDEIVDKAGTHYTVDRFGRAKPTNGGNEVPLKSLEGATVCKSWAGHAETITKAVEKKAKPKANDELKAIEQIHAGVMDADQTLVDELRKRGWTVTCTKVVEKIVYEEASL
jgi:hypothetical protein